MFILVAAGCLEQLAGEGVLIVGWRVSVVVVGVHSTIGQEDAGSFLPWGGHEPSLPSWSAPTHHTPGLPRVVVIGRPIVVAIT